MSANSWKTILSSILCAFLLTHFAYADEPPVNDKIYFLTLADFHFDPYIACSRIKTGACPLIETLRKTPSAQWAAIIGNGYDAAPQYRQDTNYPLLMSALSAAKKASDAQGVQFVMVLGDFIGHDYRDYYRKYSKDKTYTGYQAFVKKTLEFLTAELAKTFPNIDVYAVVGNNDTYQSDYYSHPRGAFFIDTSKRWATLIKNKTNQAAMQKTFSRAGYYAVDLPGSSNLRLIVLNSVLFSNKAGGNNVAQAADDELDWLHQELLSVKAKQQKAFIAMHIPIGIDIYATLRIRLFTLVELWQSKYTKRFQEELNAFAPEIAGVFAGHLHTDWFQILSFDNGNEVPITGTPSISPIFGNNPGFKVYSYSPETKQLNNFETFYYQIDKNQRWKSRLN